MEADDALHVLSVDVGASTALTNGQRNLNLNMPLREIDRLFLIATSVTNPSTDDLRIEFTRSPLNLNESAVAGPPGNSYPPGALYLLTPLVTASQVQHYGVGHCVLYKPAGHQQYHQEALQVRVTDWSGSAVTFDNLKLQFTYSRHKIRHLAPDSKQVIEGMREFKGAGRN